MVFQSYALYPHMTVRDNIGFSLKLKKVPAEEIKSNLDAKLRNQMRAEIIKLRKRIHSTFMYVTHDQTEAMTLGDRIVIMQKGGFVNQIGTPQELYNCPVNLFVAGFIGAPQSLYGSAACSHAAENIMLQNSLHWYIFHSTDNEL